MINATMVKDLRESTGAGMLDCKKALEATNGNMEEAVTWLREKGIASSAKKSSRIAAEGLALAKIEKNKAVILEVNSETDFVAKNEEFKELVNITADSIVKNDVNELEEVLDLKLENQPIKDLFAEKTSKIGEKLSLRRFKVLTKESNQILSSYSHMGGKIVTLVKLEGESEEVAKDIAMHVAAMRPLYLDKGSVDEETLEKERNILKERAQNEGLDSSKIDMIVNGRLNKFYEEVCLLEQNFIKENKMKVSEYLKNNKMKLLEFVRFEVGEGMEKRNENFADEVMKQVNN